MEGMTQMSFEINIKYNDALDLYEVRAFGYSAEIRKAMKVNHHTKLTSTVYTLLMDKCPMPFSNPIALSQGGLEDYTNKVKSQTEAYVLFLEYCQFFLNELNGG